jgi:hypothetical protein
MIMTNAIRTLMLAASLTALTANAAPALTLTKPVGLGSTGDVRPIAATPEKKHVAKRAPAALAGLCAKAAGVWSWYAGGDVVIRADGTAAKLGVGATGSATCSGDQVAIQWSDGFSDQMTLSADGAQMTKSGALLPLTVSRKSATVPPGEAVTAAVNPPTPAPSEGPEASAETPQKSDAHAKSAAAKGSPCARLAGAWSLSGTPIEIGVDGAAFAPTSGAKASLECGRESVIFHWDAWWGDRTYALSADGNTMSQAGLIPVQIVRMSTTAPGATAAAAKPGKPGKPGSCGRLAGVWTTFGGSMIIRPDGSAYYPPDELGQLTVDTAAMICNGQTVVIQYRSRSGGEDTFTLSGDGNQLVGASGQWSRTSTTIPPGQEGPPVSPTVVPVNPLDLLGF